MLFRSLDGSNFSNVTVSSGKAVNDGNTNLVLGVAFPGLGQDLGLDGKIDIPEHVTVEADTTNFKMDGTYTVAMSGILGELDLDSTDGIKSQLSSLEKGLTQLSSSSKQLVSGTK